MGDAGILPVEGRLELIEGEIIAKAPIGSRHAAIVTRANMLFVQAVAGRAIVSIQNPIILGKHSEPEPDLALIQPRDDFYALALPRADEVLLIVEVADTTLRYEREIKIPLFAHHGIPEVWLIAVDGAGRSRYWRHPRKDGIATSAARSLSTYSRPRSCPGSRWICHDSSERLERRTGMAEPFLSEIRLMSFLYAPKG
jgi:Uma2 family endonuclease